MQFRLLCVLKGDRVRRVGTVTGQYLMICYYNDSEVTRDYSLRGNASIVNCLDLLHARNCHYAHGSRHTIRRYVNLVFCVHLI